MNKIPLETSGDESPIQFRDCFSVRYIQSAALLCRLGHGIEKNSADAGEISAEALLSHEVFILNSILSSVAFLESTINELYADAADDAYFFADEKHEALMRLISEKWKNDKNFDRAPLISKYQRILLIAGTSPFGDDDPAFTNVRHLVEIRNFLMHYKREWVCVNKGRMAGEDGETQAEKFEKILKTRFGPNPFAHKNQPFFPDKCLGHGCAEWAIVNSLVAADEFFRRLDLPAPYDGIRYDLKTR